MKRLAYAVVVAMALNSGASAQTWRLDPEDGPDHKGGRMALREKANCQEDLPGLVERLLGGSEGVANAGIDLADVQGKDRYDIMVDGQMLGSVACMGDLQTLWGKNDLILEVTEAE
jgi:hypothetical protein